jgi:hypothetical protein
MGCRTDFLIDIASKEYISSKWHLKYWYYREKFGFLPECFQLLSFELKSLPG